MEDFAARCHELDTLLGVGRSFDVLGRDISVGGRRGRLWVVMGFVKDELVERLVGALQRMTPFAVPRRRASSPTASTSPMPRLSGRSRPS